MLRLSKYMKRLAHTSDQLCPLTDDDLTLADFCTLGEGQGPKG